MQVQCIQATCIQVIVSKSNVTRYVTRFNVSRSNVFQASEFLIIVPDIRFQVTNGFHCSKGQLNGITYIPTVYQREAVVLYGYPTPLGITDGNGIRCSVLLTLSRCKPLTSIFSLSLLSVIISFRIFLQQFFRVCKQKFSKQN